MLFVYFCYCGTVELSLQAFVRMRGNLLLFPTVILNLFQYPLCIRRGCRNKFGMTGTKIFFYIISFVVAGLAPACYTGNRKGCTLHFKNHFNHTNQRNQWFRQGKTKKSPLLSGQFLYIKKRWAFTPQPLFLR